MAELVFVVIGVTSVAYALVIIGPLLYWLCRARKHKKEQDTPLATVKSDPPTSTAAAAPPEVAAAAQPETVDSQVIPDLTPIVPEPQTLLHPQSPDSAPSDITDYENPDSCQEESAQQEHARDKHVTGNENSKRESTVSNGSVVQNGGDGNILRPHSTRASSLYSEIQRRSDISKSRESHARDSVSKRESAISNGHVVQNEEAEDVLRPANSTGGVSHYAEVERRTGGSVRDIIARMSVISSTSVDAEGEPIYSRPDLTKKLSRRSKDVTGTIPEAPPTPPVPDPKTPDLPPRPDNLLGSPSPSTVEAQSKSQ